jgi:predicted Fe-S protein YdhL (DUF1289 family)
MNFSPCRGGMNCTQDGSHCGGCGRSHEEIADTKKLANDIAEHILKMDYENIEDFLQFVAFKAFNKVQMEKNKD